jgi:hypothetical protein
VEKLEKEKENGGFYVLFRVLEFNFFYEGTEMGFSFC